MKIVNVHAAKTQLSGLIADVIEGEDVVISKCGTPLVRLVPFDAPAGLRQLGGLAGKIVEADDCWAPDLGTGALFYGGVLEPPETR